jgi:hypothetical protein
MKETTRYEVWPRNRPLADGIRQLEKFAADRRRKIVIGRTGHASFWISRTKRVECDDITEVGSLLADSPAPAHWQLIFHLPLEKDASTLMDAIVHVDVEPDDILVTITADDRDLLRSLTQAVEQAFGFERLPELPGDSTALMPPHATALIGCHFDDAGLAAAGRLEQFLTLLRFARVQMANLFRSASVPEKVKAAIDQHDFYFGIVTGNRDHAWITAETSYALAKSKRLVILVQKEAAFDPTLVGRDREYLTFTNSVDETFIGILQEIRRLKVIGL